MITGTDDHDPPECMITIDRIERSQSNGIRDHDRPERALLDQVSIAGTENFGDGRHHRGCRQRDGDGEISGSAQRIGDPIQTLTDAEDPSSGAERMQQQAIQFVNHLGRAGRTDRSQRPPQPLVSIPHPASVAIFVICVCGLHEHTEPPRFRNGVCPHVRADQKHNGTPDRSGGGNFGPLLKCGMHEHVRNNLDWVRPLFSGKLILGDVIERRELDIAFGGKDCRDFFSGRRKCGFRLLGHGKPQTGRHAKKTAAQRAAVISFVLLVRLVFMMPGSLQLPAEVDNGHHRRG
jgi:hypothetical protein